MDGSAHTVKLGDSSKALRPLLEPLHEWTTADSPKPPPLVLNKHCPLCSFQRLCHAQAEQEDNLSLLDGVTARMMRQYEKKGIFTVKQLSFLFNPRKPKKRSRKPPSVTHKVELQARAIATLAKRYNTEGEILTKRLVNVNRHIYGKVYFPVRSNGLKDIGHYIGVQWTSPQASGLQSLVWRHHWEKTQHAPYREVLVI